MNGNQNFDALDIISVASFLLGYQNLIENRNQSAQNDVQAANDSQATYLLNEINRRFDDQNAILAEQNRMMDRILDALEGR